MSSAVGRVSRCRRQVGCSRVSPTTLRWLGVSETMGDLARESLALVGFAGLLFYYDPRLALVCLTGAPSCVSARPSRPARMPHSAAQPGGARADVPRERRGHHRPPHRQGVRRRGREATKFERASEHFYRTSMKVTSSPALPPPMEFIGGGVCWRPRVWLAGNRRWPVVAREFTAFVAALFMMYAPAKKLSRGTPIFSKRWRRVSAFLKCSTPTMRCRSAPEPWRCRCSPPNRVPRRAV